MKQIAMGKKYLSVKKVLHKIIYHFDLYLIGCQKYYSSPISLKATLISKHLNLFLLCLIELIRQYYTYIYVTLATINSKILGGGATERGTPVSFQT